MFFLLLASFAFFSTFTVVADEIFQEYTSIPKPGDVWSVSFNTGKPKIFNFLQSKHLNRKYDRYGFVKVLHRWNHDYS